MNFSRVRSIIIPWKKDGKEYVLPDRRRRIAVWCGILFLAALMLPGCVPKVLRTPPAIPQKQPPTGAIVPPTQRPYRIDGKTYYPIPSAKGYSETGMASWYGADFHGRSTSNGETYNMYDWTAAHKTLPMHTRLLVENLENGREALVRVNDRGPFAKGRLIDLSYNTARELGMIKNGTARVRITALGEAINYEEDAGTTTRFLPFQDLNRGDYYVQIGSFANRANAEQVQVRLAQWGKDVVTVPYKSSGQLYYRIRVKAGSTLDEAKRTEKALAAAGFPDAFIVAR
jgi:rare lipoprotein A